jgi:prolipoprotein diacylglyceryltransferase
MYPTLQHLVNDLFGLPFPALPSFGFILALSFVGAYLATKRELLRKETEGLLTSTRIKVVKGKAATPADFIMAAITGFVVGYKLLFFILEAKAFAADPQALILTLDGSWIGGLLGAGISWYLRKKEDDIEKLAQPITVEIEQHPYQLMDSVVTIAAVSGIIGAKVFHQLENMDEFWQDPVGSLFSASGLTFYGGLICGAAAVLYFVTRNGIKPIHMADATAPGLMLAYGMGRVGCQVSGDGDWGIVNTLPKPSALSFLPDWFWSYTYPNNVVHDGVPIPGCEGRYCNALPEGVFPTPLYEAIVCIGLFVLLWSLRKKLTVPGSMFALYLMLNGFERFWIEKIRVNTNYHIFGSAVTQAEIISVFLFASGAYLWWRVRRNAASKN